MSSAYVYHTELVVFEKYLLCWFHWAIETQELWKNYHNRLNVLGYIERAICITVKSLFIVQVSVSLSDLAVVFYIYFP